MQLIDPDGEQTEEIPIVAYIFALFPPCGLLSDEVKSSGKMEVMNCHWIQAKTSNEIFFSDPKERKEF